MYIDWDKEPTAQFCKLGDNRWYKSWWKEVEGVMFCKLVESEHWQSKDWCRTTYSYSYISNLDGIYERPKNSTEFYIPAVGEECLAIWSVDKYKKAKVLAHDEGILVIRWKEGLNCIGELSIKPYPLGKW